MFTEEIELIKQKLLEFEMRIEDDSVDDSEEFEEAVLELESKLDKIIEYYQAESYSQQNEKISIAIDNSITELKSLKRRIDQIKTDNDFYDEEATLDMMFPDRHDPDFDEDSMSYDSVFGDD